MQGDKIIICSVLVFKYTRMLVTENCAGKCLTCRTVSDAPAFNGQRY